MRGATGTSFSLLALPVVLALSPGDAQAQTYPCKSVRFIVPAAPGGTTDIMARELAQKMGESLGVQFLVDNRAGAAGIIGTDLLVKSAPDGCTIIMGNIGPNAINASLYRKLPYDPIKDLAPVSQVISVTNVLAVHPSIPARNVKELVALAKSRPGELTFSSPGTGQSPHLSGELFKAMTGTNIVHIPYKGSFPAMMDLVGGQVSMMFDNLPTAIPHIRTGRIRALGVTSAKRTQLAPELPAIAETVPGYEWTGWYGLAAPAGTPREIVARLNAAQNDMLKNAATRERLAELGADAIGSTPPEYAEHIRRQIEKIRQTIKLAGIKLE